MGEAGQTLKLFISPVVWYAAIAVEKMAVYVQEANFVVNETLYRFDAFIVTNGVHNEII
jgi:hypothetical protein